MISIIIPALNEADTIADVIDLVRRDPLTAEVIVVDDGSIDGTPEIAAAAGARVITSTLLGKGASMEDGLRAANNDLLLYLDGDLRGLREDLVSAMTAPLRNDEADFVKAKFSRSAGRVTALTARPLLRVFFPEVAHLEQPLGGIIAARRSLLSRLRFENDYGVDVGLLLDAVAEGARLAEVDIGNLEHDSQPLDVLTNMARQVVRTLLDRAARHGRLSQEQLYEIEEGERQEQVELPAILARVGPATKLALFDIDGTLLDGRFVVSLARRTGRARQLVQYLDRPDLDADDRARRIASLFRGVPRELFEEVARTIPLSPGAVETIVGLRKAGYRVGLVTDGYHIAAEVVRRRVFADFTVSHILQFRQGVATGEITLAPAMVHRRGCSVHTRCKFNTLLHLTQWLELNPEHVIAVGDSDNDVCMLRAAGNSFAFRPKSLRVRAAADTVIEDSLSEILGMSDAIFANALET